MNLLFFLERNTVLILFHYYYWYLYSNLWFIFQVTYRADSLVLDFLKLAQDGNPLFSVIGELEWKCRDIGPGNPLAFKDNGEKNFMVRTFNLACILFFRLFYIKNTDFNGFFFWDTTFQFPILNSHFQNYWNVNYWNTTLIYKKK